MFKAPEPPCLDLGCGDNVSRQLGAEKKALLFNKKARTPSNNTACRRLPNSRSARKATPNIISGELKKCRKAASLEDMPSRCEEENMTKRRRPRPMCSPTMTVVPVDPVPPNRRILAARKVCQVLVINAWRKRRHDVKECRITIQQLETQVENLNIQTLVLRRLLDTELERVGQAHMEAQELLVQVEENIQERNAIIAEKAELLNKISNFEECIAEMQIKCENMKNDFLAAKCEVSVLETQLGKEREKLLKLREDKEHLLRKIHTNEELLLSQNQTIERLQINCKDLVAELSSEIKERKKVENDNQESKKAIKKLEMKNKKLEEELKATNEKSEQLSLKIETLQSLLEDREQQYNALKNTLQEQQVEIRALQNKHLQLQSTWGARVLDMATMFARIPFNILYSVAVIFLPHNN